MGLLPRSEIQNVSYRLRGSQLERLNYDQQDPLPGSQPTVTIVLRDVRAFGLRFTPAAAGRTNGSRRRRCRRGWKSP